MASNVKTLRRIAIDKFEKFRLNFSKLSLVTELIKTSFDETIIKNCFLVCFSGLPTKILTMVNRLCSHYKYAVKTYM